MEVPGGDSLRVPARMAMVWTLCLSAAVAIAWARVERHRRRLVFGVATVLVVAEGFAFTPAAPLAAAPAVPALAAGAPVLELPVEEGPFADLLAMYRGMAHGHPVVNGFSGYFPPHYPALIAGLMAHDGTVIDALRARGPLAIFVDRHRDPDGRTASWVRELPGAQPLQDGPAGWWFELQPVAEADAAAGAAVSPVRAVNAIDPAGGTFEGAPGAMWDGDLRTRWHTRGPKQAGDRLVIDLGETQTLRRLEIDLGDWTRDYPLGLSVAVGDDPATAVEAWSGSILGKLTTGAIANPKAAGFAISLPAGATGRYLVLTNLGSDPEFSWTVAEIRVAK
jgi:hypothetical protein